MHSRITGLAAITLTVAACHTDTLGPATAASSLTPAFGKNTSTSATSTWKLPLNAAGLGLTSDGRQPSGDGFSLYQNGVCGVTGTIFTGSGSGDATLQTNNPRQKNATCQTARTMTVVYPINDPAYPNGGSETMVVFINLRNIANATTTIPVGTRAQKILSLNPTQTERCDAWRWSDEGLAGDKVWVERLDATTYHVYTKDRDPDPDAAAASAGLNRAVCTTTNQAHNLSVDFYVVSHQALP